MPLPALPSRLPRLHLRRPRLRLPRPFAHLWAQTGAIISVGNALIAAFIGAIAYGFVGIVGVIAAWAVVASIELIRYSLQMEDERDRANTDHDEVAAQLQRAEALVAELTAERGELSRDVAALQDYIGSADLTLERTLATLMQANAGAAVVLRHRLLVSGHVDGWPVVRFAFDPDGNVVITARVSGVDASEIAREPIALHCPDMPPIDMRSATGAGDELRAICLKDDLPPSLGEDLVLKGTINPPGCRLNLRGMSLGVYPGLSYETIEALNERLKNAAEVVTRAIEEANLQGESS